MRLDIFHLRAESAFHFGLRGVGIEASADHAPSDTFFSAMCNTLRLIDSNAALEVLLAAFERREPPFLSSAAFPYVLVQDKPLRFYPAPLTFQRVADKAIRKVAWVSESLFLDWLRGPLRLEDLVKQAVMLPGAVLVTQQQFSDLERRYTNADGEVRLWSVDEVPRVAIDRLTNASNVYQAGQLRFVESGGLWCAVAGLVDGALYDRSWMRKLLMQLGHYGIGGERSAGHGQFEVLESNTAIEVPDVGANGQFVTLSHYHPQPFEVDTLGGAAAYDLILRRGWMNSPDNSSLRYKSVRMVTTGSVLTALPETGLYGGIVDVTPEVFREQGGHNVWRYGYALPIGVGG